MCQVLYNTLMISKKDQIIEAACTTLIREGSNNFSMRKVADVLSMSLGNLQYHFKTKSDLIHGIMKRYIEIYRIEFEKFFSDSNKGREVLEQFIKKILIDEVNDIDDPFFIALYGFADQKGMDTTLKYFYGELFSLLGQALETIADSPCSPEAIYRGTALLLPYIEGYGSVGSFVKLDHDEISGLLADTVWNILKG